MYIQSTETIKTAREKHYAVPDFNAEKLEVG